MSLRPLHFLRTSVVRGNDPAEFVPMYGAGAYRTDCGRFHLQRYDGCWKVCGSAGIDYLNMMNWNGWLDSKGLLGERFESRRAILEALEAHLDAEGLLETRTL